MTLKKIRKALVFAVFLTIYLNIGWGLGYYFYHNIDTKTFESASWHAKLLGGHGTFFAKDEAGIKTAKEEGPFKEGGSLEHKVWLSFFWPIILLVSIFSWIVHVVFWILKFIFDGGLFKLVFGIS